MVFLIESLVACALFTFFVFLMSRDPVKTIFNYPPAIRNASYQSVAHIKSDGTIQDASYRTIGHAGGIPME